MSANFHLSEQKTLIILNTLYPYNCTYYYINNVYGRQWKIKSYKWKLIITAYFYNYFQGWILCHIFQARCLCFFSIICWPVCHAAYWSVSILDLSYVWKRFYTGFKRYMVYSSISKDTEHALYFGNIHTMTQSGWKRRQKVHFSREKTKYKVAGFNKALNYMAETLNSLTPWKNDKLPSYGLAGALTKIN